MIKRKLVLLLAPFIFILIYLIFGVSYYSIISPILFASYFLVLFLLGGMESSLKTVLILLVVIVTLIIQWIGIDETLKWLANPNNQEQWSYGTDFLVLFSWFGLFLVSVLLNVRGYIKIRSNQEW